MANIFDKKSKISNLASVETSIKGTDTIIKEFSLSFKYDFKNEIKK